MEIETVPYSGVYNTPNGEKAANTAGQNYVYATAGIVITSYSIHYTKLYDHSLSFIQQV